MNSRIIKNLYKKEMLDVLRDKKTVIMMLVVPLVLYPLLFIVGVELMTSISAGLSENTYRVALDFEDTDGRICGILTDAAEEGSSFDIVDTEDPDTALKNEDIDAYISRKLENGTETYEIYYMSSVTASGYAADMIADVLDSYKTGLVYDILSAAGLDADKTMNPITFEHMDVSSSEESAGSMLGTIIPFMLVVSLLLGTMYPAIDTMAGERERGTLETVLTLPITNRQLIVSKFLTVATIGIISAMLNIIAMCGVGVYMYSVVNELSDDVSGIDVSVFIPAIAVGVFCVIAFAVFISAVTMCVCAFAKSYKEANNYLTPLMLVVMFASFAGFMPNMKLTSGMALAPVANVCLLIRDLLAFKINTGTIAIVLMSNILYGILAIMLLGRIYNSESILFGDGSGVQIFERRRNMVKGGSPAMGDAWLVIAVTAVAVLYIGTSIQLSFGYYGVLGTQIIIAGIPLAAALYTKKDLRQTFRIKSFRLRCMAGGILLILGAVLLGMILTMITGAIFKTSAENVEISTAGLLGDSFLETLIIVAVVPAVCEELMFRGYLFSAFVVKLKPAMAIAAVSVVFGLYHMSIVKFFTTAVIGAAICCAVYYSGSIFVGMVMHFINNALSVFLMYYPVQIGAVLPFLTADRISINEIIVIFAAGVGLAFFGLALLHTDRTKAVV